MCFIIIFLSVILQTCKHGAILHIVTINNGVKIGKISGIACFHKDGAGFIFLTAEGVGQIVNIVRRMNHRITDFGSWNLNPANGFVIDLFQRSKINTLFFWGSGFGRFFWCIIRSVIRRRRSLIRCFRLREHILLQVFVFLITGTVSDENSC